MWYFSSIVVLCALASSTIALLPFASPPIGFPLPSTFPSPWPSIASPSNNPPPVDTASLVNYFTSTYMASVDTWGSVQDLYINNDTSQQIHEFYFNMIFLKGLLFGYDPEYARQQAEYVAVATAEVFPYINATQFGQIYSDTAADLLLTENILTFENVESLAQTYAIATQYSAGIPRLHHYQKISDALQMFLEPYGLYDNPKKNIAYVRNVHKIFEVPAPIWAQSYAMSMSNVN